MTTFNHLDHHYMARAISLAKKGKYTCSPNPRVGCVLVKSGQVVGEGFHQKAGQGHAEVNALKMAGENAKGATAYVTLEPCSHFGKTPPCADALIEAGVAKVIAAMVDPNPEVSGRGLARLNKAGIKTRSGLLEADARALNPGFIKLMTTSMPYVRCKLAASLDGKTAMASGESQWITSQDARKDVQKLRAQSCAVITGADTILIDDARMSVRWHELADISDKLEASQLRQPVRVIIDSKNRLSPNLALFSIESPIILIRHTIESIHQWPAYVEQVALPLALDSNFIDLENVLSFLADRGLNDILVEAGQTLAGAFFQQDLIDELILYQAPKLMGADANSLLNLPDVSKLSQAKQLTIVDVCQIGCDIKLTALVKHSCENLYQ